MLDEALRDHIAQLGYQALIHEHLIEFSFFCINQKPTHGLVQVVEYLLKVSCSLN